MGRYCHEEKSVTEGLETDAANFAAFFVVKLYMYDV